MWLIGRYWYSYPHITSNDISDDATGSWWSLSEHKQIFLYVLFEDVPVQFQLRYSRHIY